MAKFNINSSLGFRVSTTKSLMQNCFNSELRRNNIGATAEQWGLLNTIMANPGLTQSAIAELSLKDKTNITRMLDVLERNGFIERKNDDTDRRTYRIYITPAGEALIKKIVPVAQKVNRISSAGITEKEMEVFFNVISKINNNLTKS